MSPNSRVSRNTRAAHTISTAHAPPAPAPIYLAMPFWRPSPQSIFWRRPHGIRGLSQEGHCHPLRRSESAWTWVGRAGRWRRRERPWLVASVWLTKSVQDRCTAAYLIVGLKFLMITLQCSNTACTWDLCKTASLSCSKVQVQIIVSMCEGRSFFSHSFVYCAEVQ